MVAYALFERIRPLGYPLTPHFTAPVQPVARLDIPEGTRAIPRGAMAGRKEFVFGPFRRR